MDNIYYQIGQTLKVIRMNKGYTQEDIADGKMSRSNYTKVENDEINPNVVKFFTILDHMDMSVEEFSYILNGYKLNDKDAVLYVFKQMGQSPALSYIKSLIELAQNFLAEREDHMVRDILNLTLGYSALLKDHDLTKAKSHAQKVWDRLKKLDKLYLAEYHLLNRVLYFFELETAVSMTNKALEDLKNYHTLEEADDLILSYLSNITCILIGHGQYSRAMVYVEHLITKSKENLKIIFLAAALVRKGMCLGATGNKEDSVIVFDSAIEMFISMDLGDYVIRTRQNPKTVHNPFGYVDFKTS